MPYKNGNNPYEHRKHLLHLQEHKSTYKSSKFNTSARAWNNEFDLY